MFLNYNRLENRFKYRIIIIIHIAYIVIVCCFKFSKRNNRWLKQRMDLSCLKFWRRILPAYLNEWFVFVLMYWWHFPFHIYLILEICKMFRVLYFFVALLAVFFINFAYSLLHLDCLSLTAMLIFKFSYTM